MEKQYRTALEIGFMAGMRYALTAPRRVPAGVIGSHMGQRAGASLEFQEHRDYQPGDDLRRIDWSAYARTDKLTVKLFREEVNPHIDILLDTSASMALTETPKAEGALGLVAALTAAAGNSGFTHAVYQTRDGCEPVLNGNESPTVWDDLTFECQEPLEESLAKLPPAWRPRSVRMLISDLLFMGDPLLIAQQFAQGAAAVCFVQVLAREDTTPPHRGNVRLVDSETGELREVFVDAAMQKLYRDSLAAHQENWNRAALQVGASMRTFIAQDLMTDWDLAPLVEAAVLQVG